MRSTCCVRRPFTWAGETVDVQRSEDREDRLDATVSPPEPDDPEQGADEAFNWREYEAWKAAPPEDGVPLWMLDE